MPQECVGTDAFVRPDERSEAAAAPQLSIRDGFCKQCRRPRQSIIGNQKTQTLRTGH